MNGFHLLWLLIGLFAGFDIGVLYATFITRRTRSKP